MGDIFYGIGLIVVGLNIASLIRYRKIFEINEWLSVFKKVAGRTPARTDFRSQSDLQVLLTWSFTVVMTVIWMFFGLLSKNWVIFLSIFGFNIILNHISKFFNSYRRVRLFIKFSKSVIMVAIMSFLVINHFHLKMNLLEELKLFFKH